MALQVLKNDTSVKIGLQAKRKRARVESGLSGTPLSRHLPFRYDLPVRHQAICAMVLRKRASARQTTQRRGQQPHQRRPHHRQPRAPVRDGLGNKPVKCVVGASDITYCTHSGMLSRVMPPDSISSGIMVSTINRPNCGMLRARGRARCHGHGGKRVQHRAQKTAVSGLQSAPQSPTDHHGERHPRWPTSTTSAMAHTLASMISAGVTGADEQVLPRCRARARGSGPAPVRMMEHGDG